MRQCVLRSGRAPKLQQTPGGIWQAVGKPLDVLNIQGSRGQHVSAILIKSHDDLVLGQHQGTRARAQMWPLQTESVAHHSARCRLATTVQVTAIPLNTDSRRAHICKQEYTADAAARARLQSPHRVGHNQGYQQPAWHTPPDRHQ
jgi:hypothetical protein